MPEIEIDPLGLATKQVAAGASNRPRNLKNLSIFFIDKLKNNPNLSVMYYLDGSYFIQNDDIKKYAAIGNGKLLICRYPKMLVSVDSVSAMEKNVIAEISGNTISIHSLAYKGTFYRWIAEFQEKTGEKIII